MPIELTTDQRRVYQKYADLTLPRHTSYPSVTEWRADFSAQDFEALLRRRQDGPLGLYVHVPFCRSLCLYCGCTKEIVGDERRRVSDPSSGYLDALSAELRRLRQIVGPTIIDRIHLGGGTPTFLTAASLARLWEAIRSNFIVAPDAELAVEVDPRTADEGRLQLLRSLGFSRVSLGVQDFDEEVQRTVNRVQPFEKVRDLVGMLRAQRWSSINFDLIYGLPKQSLASLEKTIEKVCALEPDRIAFYRLAALPEKIATQRGLTRWTLPSGQTTLDMMLLAIARFGDAGYDFIGLDHFAMKTDSLAKAFHAGKLGRSFQGMDTARGVRTIGAGPSAISSLGRGFAQNLSTFGAWRERLESGTLATARGVMLSDDDIVRADLLQDLYANARIEWDELVLRHGERALKIRDETLARLRDLEVDGIVSIRDQAIELTPLLGRILARVAAAVFDAYLPHDAYKSGVGAAASKIG